MVSASSSPEARVADAVNDGTAYLWLDPAWPGWAREDLKLGWRAGNGGVAKELPVVAGLHTLVDLPVGQQTGIQIRFSTPGEVGEWTQVGMVSPTRSSVQRFAAWADGFHSETISEAVAGVGLKRAVPSELNAPLRLPGGAELEYISGPNSLFAKYFAFNSYKYVVRIGETPGQGQRVIRESRHRHFEPAGAYAALSPLEVHREPFFLRLEGEEVDRRGEVVVLGACGAHGQPAMSAVGLDREGDPVAFRFDRPVLVGRSLDGVPWVMGPVRLLRNGGLPLELEPGVVMTEGGALLAVVERPGHWPSRARAVRIDLLPAYRSLDTELVWPENQADVADPADLTVQAQFESLHLYLQSSSADLAEVRFAKVGEERWFPGQALTFDAKVPKREPIDHAAVVPGNHRGVIIHLEPATSYRVQVRQDGKIWEQVATTLSFKTRKLRSVAVGIVDGDLVISEGGQPGAYVEYHSGLIRGGTVRVEASHVLLRDIDILGAPEHGMVLADTVKDVRLVRGRIAGWGRSDQTEKPENFGWARQMEGGIYCLAKEPEVNPHDIAVIGVHFGSPRFPANTWEEYNPSHSTPREYFGSSHPWGAQGIGLHGGIYRGGWTITDCSFEAHPLRSYNDGVGGNINFGPGPGGFGPNFVFSYNFVSGAADDAIEHEGSCANGIILGNTFDNRILRPDTRGSASPLAMSSTYWGPTMVARNRFVRHSPEGWGSTDPRENRGPILKIKRFSPAKNSYGNDGRILLFNNTAYAPSIELAFHKACPTMEGWGGHLRGHNNLFLTREGPSDSFPGEDVVWSPSNRIVLEWSEWPAMQLGIPALKSAAGLRVADPLPNVTDGGPFAVEAANGLIGAMPFPSDLPNKPSAAVR